VTPAVTLALLLTASTPLALVKLEEHLPVPGARGVVSQPFQKQITVTLAPGVSAEVLARRLQGDSRICPRVTAEAGALVLHCTTEKVRVDLALGSKTSILQLRRLSVPAWRPQEEGPPLTAFDPEALGLGACPGTTPLARGECALAAGDLALARKHFLVATASGDSAHAEMRLGDLALAADEPDVAVAAWRRARSEAPWSRLVAMRLCELEPGCIGSPVEEAVYDGTSVPVALRADVFLRRARLAALRGDIVGTAQVLGKELRVGGACKGAPGWCRHILSLALRLPPPDGTEALAVYLEWPGRLEGPDALELALAAAHQAEAAGAPLWAANMLAAQTGRIPAARQGAHLRRVGELYLAGGDRVRADEVLRFARTKLSKKELAAPGWAALARALRGPAAAPDRVPAPDEDPDLAAARAALDAAKLAGLRKGTAP